MRKVILVLIVGLAAVTARGLQVPTRFELADMSIDQFSRSKSSEIEIYGVSLATPVADLDELAKAHGLENHADPNDSFGFFTKGRGSFSGFEGAYAADKISFLRLTVRNSVTKGAPVRKYIESMTKDLRAFFENYDEGRRIGILGESKRRQIVNNQWMRSYHHDYVDRGMMLVVNERLSGKPSIELDHIVFFPPGGRPPY